MNEEIHHVYKLLRKFDRSRTRKQRAALVKKTYNYLSETKSLLTSPVFRKAVSDKMKELRAEPPELSAVYAPAFQKVVVKLQQTRKVKK